MKLTTLDILQAEIKACIKRSRAYWNSQLYALSSCELEKARRYERRIELIQETGDYK